jgi:hypothetical protein
MKMRSLRFVFEHARLPNASASTRFACRINGLALRDERPRFVVDSNPNKKRSP